MVRVQRSQKYGDGGIAVGWTGMSQMCAGTYPGKQALVVSTQCKKSWQGHQDAIMAEREERRKLAHTVSVIQRCSRSRTAHAATYRNASLALAL